VLETFIKICRENPNVINIAQKYRALYMKSQYASLLPATISCHKITQQKYYKQSIVAFPWRWFQY